jgi:hypothetical protein
MEPRREVPPREEPKAPEPHLEEKPKRFRILRLEERMPPAHLENQWTWSSIV